MLWFQAGASDLNRAGTKRQASGIAGSGESPSGWFLTFVLSVVVGAINFVVALCVRLNPKGRKGKPRGKAGRVHLPASKA